MATMTLAEAQAQLTTVNAAIDQLLSGNRLTQLRVGSGTFQRLYTYQEISLESLTALRNELNSVIDALSPAIPIFRNNATIPLKVSKDIY